MKFRAEVALGLLSLAIVGCSGKNNDSGGSTNPAPSSTSPMDLLHSDLGAINTIDPAILAKFDSDNNGIFTKVFGGTTPDAINSYLNARVHHYLLADDQLQIVPSSAESQPWMTAPTSDTSSNVKVGALNIGMELWLASVFGGYPVSVSYDGTSIPVTSSRAGIVILAEGYSPTIQDTQGNSYDLPPEWRQSILAHEARHSDCTGGLTAADVAVGTNATDSKEFDAQFKARDCGHLHVICPDSNVDFHGLYACDQESWGAYAVGAVYAAALAGKYASDPHSPNYELMSASAIDSQSRLLVDQTGDPDMSTSGVLSGGGNP